MLGHGPTLTFVYGDLMHETADGTTKLLSPLASLGPAGSRLRTTLLLKDIVRDRCNLKIKGAKLGGYDRSGACIVGRLGARGDRDGALRACGCAMRK